jgi:hypothetical protein
MSTSATLSLDRITRALAIAEQIAALEAELDGFMDQPSPAKMVRHKAAGAKAARRGRKRAR